MRAGPKVALAVVPVLLMALAAGAMIFRTFAHIQEPLDYALPEALSRVARDSELDGHAQQIRFYDEVLTQSARNYAFTGDTKWRDRYLKSEPILDMHIKEAIATGDSETTGIFRQVDAANIALVAMEHQALEDVNEGLPASARAVLESSEYWRQKDLYREPLDRYAQSKHATADVSRNMASHLLGQAVGDTRSAVASGEAWATVIVCIGLAALLFLSYLATRLAVANDRARLAEARVQRLLAVTPAVIYSRRPSGDFGATFLSDHVTTQLGYEPRECIGDPAFWTSRIHPEDAPLVFEGLHRLLQEGRYVQEYRILHKDGTYRWMHDSMILVTDASGKPQEIVGYRADVSDRRTMEEELRALSLVDPLTGLSNRRGFATLGEQMLKLARRQEHKLLLIYADQDGLKSINDRFGHSEGDHALVETASVLRETFRDADIVGRVGGDEFAAVAIVASGDEDGAILKRLRAHIEARNGKGDLPFDLSLSIGAAASDVETRSSLDDLLKRADEQMYEEKRSKPGRA